MRRIVLSFCLLWSIGAGTAEPNEEDRAKARQLGMELKAALTAALQGSPESAIAVCNERAPQIAAKLTREGQVEVGRTALRVRNPANQPSEWQRAVLLDFQNRQKSGESLAAMEHWSTVTRGDFVEHRYMKAIALEPLCVTCHGSQLSPALRDAIRAKYPADAATGFNVGDLRGAVYVVRREPRPR